MNRLQYLLQHPRNLLLFGLPTVLMILCLGLFGYHRYVAQHMRYNTLMLQAFYADNEQQASSALARLQNRSVLRWLSDGQKELLNLQKARQLVNTQQLEPALEILIGLVKTGKVAELQEIALVRAIRIYSQLHRTQEARTLLHAHQNWLPKIAFLELQGDLAYANHQAQEARRYYLAAKKLARDQVDYTRLTDKIISD